MKIKNLSILLLALLPIMFCNCSVTSAKRVGPNGVVSSFYQGAVGGKGAAVQKTGSGDDANFIATYYDNEKSFRDGVIGLVTYGLGNILGNFGEAAVAAKTARHATTAAQQTAAAEAAAKAAALETKAGLIETLGVPGEVGIAPLSLP